MLELSVRNPGYQLERSAAGDLIVTAIGGEQGRREARLAVLIDPQRRAVEIYAPDQDPQVVESGPVGLV